MTNGQRKRARLAAKATGAVIYLRVSTSRQKESGVGIEAQEAECREWCARQGIPVIGTQRDEAVSGKDGLDRRPGLRAVLEQVRENPGCVVVAYSLSRLGRSQRLIWNLLDDRGEYALPFASATEPFDTSTPMGKAMLGMLAVWSQLQADLISEVTVDALAAVAERGVRLGNPTMIESRRKDGEEVVRFVDPAKVAVVRQVQELYSGGGFSHRSLADHLNAEGTPTAKGGRWHAKTVRTAIATEIPAEAA